MKNILLVCCAGMSTSLLVKRMEEAAKKNNYDVKISAYGETDARRHVETADIILLGPQVRYLLKKFQELSGDIPVEVIDMVTYGRVDGESVLKSALEKIGSK